jgi:RimJ/RimL family protein N-acetyltransferase
MFERDGVMLRPLELEDTDTMYAWHLDYELDIYSSWGRRRSRALFAKRCEERILEPADDYVQFGVVYGGKLVGRIELALIDLEQRRASVGLIIGDRSVWGRGIATRALQMMIDYAFTVANLEKVCAEVYGFNVRSQRLMEAAGMQKEGVLRQHELHNGGRQDMHVYGVLKDEFYQHNQTLFTVPELYVEP